MRRVVAFVYGVVCYAVFFATFCYACGFVGNFAVPKSIDSTPQGALVPALLVDLLLLAIFALQHSVMARPAFKRWWTRLVPTPIERSTYVLLSCVALIALFILWQPVGGTVWNVEHPVGRAGLYGLFGAGWLLVFVATFLINHFDLFGLRQVWLYLRGREYRPLGFRTPAFYGHVRHPLYVGWLVAFWATPTMTGAHLLFAVMTTVYILVAIRFEEKDLSELHGEPYVEYRRRVPMLIPALFGRRTSAGVVQSAADSSANPRSLAP